MPKAHKVASSLRSRFDHRWSATRGQDCVKRATTPVTTAHRQSTDCRKLATAVAGRPMSGAPQQPVRSRSEAGTHSVFAVPRELSPQHQLYRANAFCFGTDWPFTSKSPLRLLRSEPRTNGHFREKSYWQFNGSVCHTAHTNLSPNDDTKGAHRM